MCFAAVKKHLKNPLVTPINSALTIILLQLQRKINSDNFRRFSSHVTFCEHEIAISVLFHARNGFGSRSFRLQCPF
jgi:hypothetical protein